MIKEVDTKKQQKFKKKQIQGNIVEGFVEVFFSEEESGVERVLLVVLVVEDEEIGLVERETIEVVVFVVEVLENVVFELIDELDAADFEICEKKICIN